MDARCAKMVHEPQWMHFFMCLAVLQFVLIFNIYFVDDINSAMSKIYQLK